MFNYRPDFNKLLEAKSVAEFRELIDNGFPINGCDIEGNSILFLTDDAEIAKAAIEYGINLESRNSGNLTAICTQTNDDVIRVMIQAGANVNPELKYSNNLPLGQYKLSSTSFKRLLDAGAKPYPHLLIEVVNDIEKVKLLLKAGVNVNDNDDNYIPLNSVTNPAIMRLLLDAGADAKHIVHGETCFWTSATDADNSEQISMLLEAGADPTLLSPKGQTTLMLARTPHVVQALIQAGVNPLAVSQTGQTAIMHDMTAEALKILLDTGIDPHAVDHNNKNALFYIKNADALKILIQKGININLHDTIPKDPQYYSYDRAGSTPLFHVKNAEAAHVLIEAGADVNARNADGRTPLFFARDIEIVRILIQSGADVTVQDRFKWIAGMEYMYENSDASIDVLKAFADAGMDLFSKTDRGYTLLHFAPNAAIARYLIAHGLDVNAASTDGTTPIISTAEYDDVVQILIEAGADVNVQDHYGFTALMIAADHCNEASVRMLIEAGADVNASRGRAHHSVVMTAVYASSPRILEMLAKAGANVDQRTFVLQTDDQGIENLIPSQTPLMLSDFHPEAALALIALGADVNARDAKGMTPLMYHVENDQVMIALIQAGADVNAIDNEGHDIIFHIRKNWSNPEKHLKELIEQAL